MCLFSFLHSRMAEEKQTQKLLFFFTLPTIELISHRLVRASKYINTHTVGRGGRDFHSEIFPHRIFIVLVRLFLGFDEWKCVKHLSCCCCFDSHSLLWSCDFEANVDLIRRRRMVTILYFSWMKSRSVLGSACVEVKGTLPLTWFSLCFGSMRSPTSAQCCARSLCCIHRPLE